MDSFNSIADKIIPHPQKAQILLELNSGEETLERALAVLHAAGIDPVEYSFIREDLPAVLLLYIPVDVSNAARRLTESGFSKLRGINPIHHVNKS